MLRFGMFSAMSGSFLSLRSGLRRLSFCGVWSLLMAAAIAVPIHGYAQAPGTGSGDKTGASSQAEMRDQFFDRVLGHGSGAWTPAQMEAMAKLRDAALTDSYALDELRHLTDNIGPRLSGSTQAQAAVEYVAGEMRKLGAEVTLEKTAVPHWVRGEETAELVSWPGMAQGTTQKVILTALGSSVATPKEGLTAEVVVADSWADLKKLDPAACAGKILLLNEKFDKQLAAQEGGLYSYGEAVEYRAAAPGAGALMGAAAVLVRSVGGADYRIAHAGQTEYAPNVKKIPAGAVTAEDADMLADLVKQGPVTMHLTLTPETLPDATSYNVIADWKGTEHPEQVVVVSGHLDSWDLGTGAIDDGAGIVVSMQAIHLLQKLGIHPEADGALYRLDERRGRLGGRGNLYPRSCRRCREPYRRD